MGWTSKELWFNSQQRQEIYFFKTSKPDMRPNKPPIQWVLGVLVYACSGLGLWRWLLTPILPRMRKCWALPLPVYYKSINKSDYINHFCSFCLCSHPCLLKIIIFLQLFCLLLYKSIFFCNVTLRIDSYQLFWRTSCLHLQGRRFYPENGGSRYLSNTGTVPLCKSTWYHINTRISVVMLDYLYKKILFLH